MKHPRIIGILFAGALACLPAFGAAVDGDLSARQSTPVWASTDLGDEQAKVDVTNCVRLIVPPGRHTGAFYQLSASFTGDHEKCISVFEWAGDDTGKGMWERKAFFNTRWNGNPANGNFLLETGRSYLIACHEKGGNPPLNNDQPWVQDHLAHDASDAVDGTGNDTGAPAADSAPEYPSAAAHFSDGDDTATASLTFVKTNNVGRALSSQ